MTSATRRRLKQLLGILAVVCAITPLFNFLTDAATLRSAAQGVIDGIIVTALVGGFLLFVRGGRLRAPFRRLGFSPISSSAAPSCSASSWWAAPPGSW